MKEELRNAYKLVFDDLTKGSDSPSFFIGNYDAKNGSEYFMYGVGTVMELIAYKIGDEVGDEFSDRFTKNLIKSELKR